MTPAYRQIEIDTRRHLFNVTTPAERRARRKRLAEAAIITILVGAVAFCGWQSLSPLPPGTAPEASNAAPGTLTHETAPVRWRKRDFIKNPSSARVAPTTTLRSAEYGKSSARPGGGAKRKAK